MHLSVLGSGGYNPFAAAPTQMSASVAAFIAWALLPVVMAWAVWLAFGAFHGGLLHLWLRRFGIGLAAPTWVRITVGVTGAGLIITGWAAWGWVGWAGSMVAAFLASSHNSATGDHVTSCMLKALWVGALALVAWLSFWLGRAGQVTGLATMSVLAGICLFAASDPIAAALIALTTPAGIGLGILARRLWPGDKTREAVPIPPRPLAEF